MEHPIARRNMITLANSVELATLSIQRVLGKNCSKTVNGQKQTKQIIADAVTAKINSRLADTVRGG